MRVAISGAGVAGPTLAYWLRRSGHEITLIEKAPSFRDGGYIIDFWGHGYTVAERMGVLPEVLRRGYRVREVRIVGADGRRLGGFGVDVFRRMTDDRYISVPRGDLAEAIFRAVEGGIETRFGDSIVSIDQNDDSVDVALASGGTRTFDLVIGADGLHSVVRELEFGPQSLFERDLGYRVAAFDLDGYEPRDELIYVLYNEPGLHAARFALRDDRTLILFVFAAELDRGPEPEDAAGRKARLRAVFGGAGWECDRILDRMDALDDVYYDRVAQIRMESWSSGRVALVGDAAACPSLLAGEGTGLAMTEAYLLAGELARAGGDHVAAFRAWEDRLHAFLTAKQDAATNFAGAFAPKTRAGLWFRNLVARLLRFRPVAERFIGRDLRDDLELPEYDFPG